MLKVLTLKTLSKLLQFEKLTAVQDVYIRNVHVEQLKSREPPPEMVEIYINGMPIKKPKHYTALQALRSEGIALPSFCYHERLSIAGNCRMCLVEIEGMMKPQIACAVNLFKGLKIRTNSSRTWQAQEGVLEMILADHPLDCPICDQGGECDLQDLTMKFGNDRSRFTEINFGGKRAVEDKDLGPFIRTCMNRCIHCTRCIRFGSQVCGIDVLGTTGRAHDMLVGTYVDKMFLSELSGNIIDLCPVGSLTSIPYMFKARAWEIRRANAIDVTDATGTNIQLNYRFDRVLRVLPRENGDVNQEWVSDKGRWSIDSLEMQRLVTPLIRCGHCLCPIEWSEALKAATAMILSESSIAAVAGSHSSIETLIACKDLVNHLGSEQLYIKPDLPHLKFGADLRYAYSLNIRMKNIAKADKIILIGTNPRFEAPILNVWIRQAYRENECDIYAVGPNCDYNYYVDYLGDGDMGLERVQCIMSHAQRPLVLIGQKAMEDHGPRIIKLFVKVKPDFFRKHQTDWPVFNVIPKDASYAGALEIGYHVGAVKWLKQIKPKVVIVLGRDDLFDDWQPPDDCKVIYIGFQGDKGAKNAHLVLPGAAFTEAGGTYMNMENRAQYSQPAVTPPGKARVDWKIIRAIAEYCCINLPYQDQFGLMCRMEQMSPSLAALDTWQYNLYGEMLEQFVNYGGAECIDLNVELKRLEDFYCSDVYTFNSPNMVKGRKAATKYHQLPYAKN